MNRRDIFIQAPGNVSPKEVEAFTVEAFRGNANLPGLHTDFNRLDAAETILESVMMFTAQFLEHRDRSPLHATQHLLWFPNTTGHRNANVGQLCEDLVKRSRVINGLEKPVTRQLV